MKQAKSLKKRFKHHARLLNLYPKRYRRQYASQILQVIADQADAKRKNGGSKQVTAAYFDLIKHLPIEHYKESVYKFSRNPKKYIYSQLAVVVVLISPLLGIISLSYILPMNTLYGNARVAWILTSYAFGNIVYVFFPMIASLIVLRFFLVWLGDRHALMHKKITKKVKLAIIVYVILALICLGFSALMVYVRARSYVDTKKAQENTNLYLSSHPGDACNIVTLKKAREIMGAKTEMSNKYFNPADTTTNIDQSSCMYYRLYQASDAVRVDTLSVTISDIDNQEKRLLAQKDREQKERDMQEIRYIMSGEFAGKKAILYTPKKYSRDDSLTELVIYDDARQVTIQASKADYLFAIAPMFIGSGGSMMIGR